MLRRRSIRLRIIVLVLVPVIGLIGLYAEVLNLTLGKVLTLRQEASIRKQVTLPVANVQRELGNERADALAFLARPGKNDLHVLATQGAKTDLAISKFAAAVQRALASGPGPKERGAFLTWQADLNNVRGLRTSVVKHHVTKIQAAKSYSAILEGGDNVLNQAILPVLNGPLGIQAVDLLAMTKASQALGEESDLISADLLAGSFPSADMTLISQLAVLHHELVGQTLPDLDPALRGNFASAIPRSAASRLGSLEAIITAGPIQASQVTPSEWVKAESAYRNGFRAALLKSTKTLTQQANSQASQLVVDLLIIASIGLLAILAAIVVGIVLGRGLIRQLSDLRQSAVRLSTDQLPGAISRLRAGEDVSVGAEVPQLEPGSDEIGQVREAFNSAARTAIGAAIDEIKIRQGVNDVFRSLARRNQSLLTRQLQLLDSMERRVHDPEELADLFRVDHMTTRMRRHAEGLLIVAGGSSGRTWREPVPIVDVMRASAAEVEDYTRVRVTSRTEAALAGHAVADVIHLLAELLENAATFSPANTPVRMDGGRVGRGVTVEIEDRGLGMSEDQLASINATLTDPPLFDLSGSDQLGLFIAGQLAKRHGVRITLRSSAYGGVTAVVLIPTELIIDGELEGSLAIAAVRELGGTPVPELPAALEPAMSLAAAAPAATGSARVLDLDSTAVISEAPGVAEKPAVATAVPDAPSWIVEPASEHSAWPGAVPLVSGPLPASSPSAPVGAAASAGDTTTGGTTTGGPAFGGAATTGHAVATTTTGPVAGGTASAGQAEPVGPAPAAAEGPMSSLQSELPTRRPGTTGLTWGENSLAGSRWAGFPMNRTVTGPARPAQPRGPAQPTAPAEQAPPAEEASPAEPAGPALPTRPALPKRSALPTRPAQPTRPVQPTGPERPAGPIPATAPSQARQPAVTSASTTSAEQVSQADAAPQEIEGLPVRVRQANLAPQLRTGAPASEPSAGEPAAPSPEAARSTMAALQLGWQRGRSLAEPAADAPATDEPAADEPAAGEPAAGEPAAGGTPAGEPRADLPAEPEDADADADAEAKAAATPFAENQETTGGEHAGAESRTTPSPHQVGDHDDEGESE